MGKYNDIYQVRLSKLTEFCDDKMWDLDMVTLGVEYRIMVTGGETQDMFGNSEKFSIVISSANDTRVSSNGSLDIDAASLKKLIGLVEKAARAYFVAWREERLEPPLKNASDD